MTWSNVASGRSSVWSMYLAMSLGTASPLAAVRDPIGAQVDEAAHQLGIELRAALAEAAGLGARVCRVAAGGAVPSNWEMRSATRSQIGFG